MIGIQSKRYSLQISAEQFLEKEIFLL